jgi:hypothetical protein
VTKKMNLNALKGRRLNLEIDLRSAFGRGYAKEGIKNHWHDRRDGHG